MDFTEHRLSYLTRCMHEFNCHVAPGSECNAWQDYVTDCMSVLGIAPWDAPGAVIGNDDFWSYWIDVADGVSSDYDKEGGRADG